MPGLDASAVRAQLAAVGIDVGVKLPGVGLERILLAYVLQDLSRRGNLPPFVSRGVRIVVPAQAAERSLGLIAANRRSLRVWCRNHDAANVLRWGIEGSGTVISRSAQTDAAGWISTPLDADGRAMVHLSGFRSGSTTAAHTAPTEWPELQIADVDGQEGAMLLGNGVDVSVGQVFVVIADADNKAIEATLYAEELGP